MTWVLFDYGCVISEPQPEPDLAALAAAAAGSAAGLQEPYWRRRHAYDLSELDARSYWSEIGAALGVRYSDAALGELIRLDSQSWLHLAPGTVTLIGELAGASLRLALLSNAPVEVAAAIAALPVLRCFEHLLFSCHLGAAKPDPRCYHLTLDRLGARPDEVIFLDDRPGNVAAAAGLGIRAVHFTGAEQARKDILARLGSRDPVRPALLPDRGGSPADTAEPA